MIRKPRMKSVLLIALFAISISAKAQIAGSYRTQKSGNWKDKNVWQVYQNNIWISATTFPIAKTVTITVNTNIDLDTALDIGDDFIYGKLSINNVENIDITNSIDNYGYFEFINSTGSVLLNNNDTSTALFENATMYDGKIANNSLLKISNCNLTFNVFLQNGTLQCDGSNSLVLNEIVSDSRVTLYKNTDFPHGTKVKFGMLTQVEKIDASFGDTVYMRYCSLHKLMFTSTAYYVPERGLPYMDTLINYGTVVLNRYLGSPELKYSIINYGLLYMTGYLNYCYTLDSLYNYGTIFITPQLISSGTSFDLVVVNTGVISGSGKLVYPCNSASPLKGEFDPKGSISLSFPVDSMSLKVSLYLNNSQVMNDLIELASPSTLGKKLIAEELDDIPPGKYKIVNVISGSGSYTGTFDSLYLPLKYSVEYKSDGIYLIKESILPILLNSFTASASCNTAILNWQTAQETNNKGFYVEQSTDGAKFTQIGFVAGKGNSTTKQNYTYPVNGVVKGNYFYRLQQVDYDGRTTYSKVIPITINCTNSNLKLYPNPVVDIVFAQLQDASTSITVIKIFDAKGSLISTQTFTNASTAKLNVASLSKGVYMIEIVTTTGTVKQKFIKQ